MTLLTLLAISALINSIAIVWLVTRQPRVVVTNVTSKDPHAWLNDLEKIAKKRRGEDQ